MKMKKLFLGAMALLATVTLVACGSKKDAYLSIKENKKLVVAVSPDYAPFEFKTLVDGKDQVVGSDIKLAQAIADELGVKLEVTTMSFDNVLSSLQSGKADLAISGISVQTNVRKPLISHILTTKHKMLSSFAKIKSLLTQVLMLSKVRK